MRWKVESVYKWDCMYEREFVHVSDSVCVCVCVREGE